jgi:hypothetical protein
MHLKVKHLKTGNHYYILNNNVINATNENDGKKMILYYSYQTDQHYVREEKEFFEKFEVVV